MRKNKRPIPLQQSQSIGSSLKVYDKHPAFRETSCRWQAVVDGKRAVSTLHRQENGKRFGIPVASNVRLQVLYEPDSSDRSIFEMFVVKRELPWIRFLGSTAIVSRVIRVIGTPTEMDAMKAEKPSGPVWEQWQRQIESGEIRESTRQDYAIVDTLLAQGLDPAGNIFAVVPRTPGGETE